MKYPEERQGLLFYYHDDGTEKAKQNKLQVRRFWFMIVPICGVAALVLSVVSDTNVFFPAWLVLSLLGGCYDAGRSSD